MAKLYVFGIGGTGARVLKSLTMLLASGVDCPFDIVPIIIDRDVQNGDFDTASILIKNYMNVNNVMSSPDCKFFKTKISLVGQNDTTTGQLCLQWDQHDERFDNFINYTTLDESNKALVDMLFSRETLEMDMSQGFQGNPNMGCVVQNQFEGNPLFDTFAQHFQSGDRIFIVSSIFGGTGASGFPLLQKLLHKTRDAATGNWGPIKNAPIGAITVLPYYNVTSADSTDNSSVNAQEWSDKAKAALDYYISEQNHIDTLYYIGDTNPTTYQHCKGGVYQTDPAHIVEMASALSILNFAKLPTNGFTITNSGNSHVTTYKEFGISDDKQDNFKMLYQETQNTVVEPLSRFLLFAKYMGYNAFIDNNPKIVKITDKIAKKDSNNHFDKTGITESYAILKGFDNAFRQNELQSLEFLQKNYIDWLIEMEAQTRSFSPFQLEVSRADVFVKGTLNLWNGAFLNKNWGRVTKTLNDTHSKVDEALSKSQKFLLLFSRVTEQLLTIKTH